MSITLRNSATRSDNMPLDGATLALQDPFRERDRRLVHDYVAAICEGHQRRSQRTMTPAAIPASAVLAGLVAIGCWALYNHVFSGPTPARRERRRTFVHIDKESSR